MMWLVRIALRFRYTFVVMAILITLLGIVTIFGMSTDILPEIDLPVVSVGFVGHFLLQNKFIPTLNTTCTVHHVVDQGGMHVYALPIPVDLHTHPHQTAACIFLPGFRDSVVQDPFRILANTAMRG